MRLGTLLLLLALASPAATAEEAPPVATIRLEQVQVAFLFSGNLGGGVLTFEGKDFGFKLGGLGIGGLGASRLSAEGEVWGLARPEDLEGVYAQVRAGAVAGHHATDSYLWIENASGVRIRLRSQREGVALSVGGDAIVIRMD